ncbi:MAG: GDSL-type esterase/lipase family protein [Verrucomicrobia bacterium]|nr:GDSL-type esterase/lipase family protein [Verrucomicrobiota bacterium]
MLLRLLCTFLLASSAVFAADEVLSDKSSPSKVLALYQKVLAAAQKEPPAPGSVICIGSSHMQLWKGVKEDLAPLTVHNYGIGGSRMTHAADLFIDNLAIPFKPRAVILYEGSNDINAGTQPEEVLANFRKPYGKLHASLPQARLYVLGVVPSPGKRFEKIADLRKTNELLAKECATQPWMKFIDVTEPLIGADGKPREELFKPGDIHMLPAGYAVWKSVIAPVIVPAEKPFEHVK